MCWLRLCLSVNRIGRRLMHRLSHRQKVIAVKAVQFLRQQPPNKRPTQKDMGDFVGVSQSQLSRHLSMLVHIRFLEKVGGALVEGPRAQDYLADWAVYLLSEPPTRPPKGRVGAMQ
jgi:hypothetical protein